jgi:acyl dehydratase
MISFAQLSGDSNPLHADDDYAQKFGFESRVVFGALLIAKISALIGVHLPGPGSVWAGLKIDFRNPLYVNEEATLSAKIAYKSDAARMLTLKLRIDSGERLIATGAAETLLRSSETARD